MLRVTNYGAACCAIEGKDMRILCDPWFTCGIYHGAWEREDYIPDPLTVVGPCDYVYISHLHPDHFDPVFLRTYLKAYPLARVWINPDCPHLARLAAEFDPISSRGILGDACIASIFANPGDEAQGIDSVLVVGDADSAVVNLNDNQYDARLAEDIIHAAGDRHLTALIPYTGAGPWPHCFLMPPEEQQAAGIAKRQRFLDQFERWRRHLAADVAVPFSAGYRLRGELALLNYYRCIPDQLDVPNATVLPVTGKGPAPYVPWTGFDWESPETARPTDSELRDLVRAAEAKAPKVDGAPLLVKLDWGGASHHINCTSERAPHRHETIFLDPRLLAGLLTRRYHWNTLEISGALRFRRHADHYDPRVFQYLTRFHV